ncbi:MAG TPA: hypothetical protein VGO56_09455 [Pyrinomonadaceae bacterium]|nr:hypothetical protein [Pyrinomonadaceae bacterium]
MNRELDTTAPHSTLATSADRYPLVQAHNPVKAINKSATSVIALSLKLLPRAHAPRTAQ